MVEDCKIAEADELTLHQPAERIQVTTAENGGRSANDARDCKDSPTSSQGMDGHKEGRDPDQPTDISGSGVTAESDAAPQVGETGIPKESPIGLPGAAPVQECVIDIAKAFLGPQCTKSVESFIRGESDDFSFQDSEAYPAISPDGQADDVAGDPVGDLSREQLGAGDAPASTGSQVFQWGPCKRCGHCWNSRRNSTGKPKWCANCRSVGWETIARPKIRSRRVKKVLVKRAKRASPPIPIESAPVQQVPAQLQETPAVAASPGPRPLGVLTPPPGWKP